MRDISWLGSLGFLGGSRGASFSPLDISGLQLWLKADAGTYQDAAMTTLATADSDPVGGWADQSGNDRNVTQSVADKRPILKLNIRNGRPVIRADGVDDFLSFSSLSLTDYTIYIAYHRTGTGVADGTWWLLSGPISGSEQGIFAGGVAPGTDGFGSMSGGQNRRSDYRPSTFCVATWQNAANFHNGCETFYNGTGTITGMSLTRIFHMESYDWDYMDADIGEILIYNSIHDATTRTKVEQYLGQRWGIQTLGMGYSLPSIGPGLILMFDDGKLDSNNNIFYGFRYMQARGLAATDYLITGSVDSAGFLTQARLQIMDAAGWDLANHTHDNVQLATLSLGDQQTEMDTARDTLNGWGFTRASNHLSFPAGSDNADTHTAMHNEGILTGRDIDNPVYLDPATIDPHDFGLSLYMSNTHVLADLQTAVNTAISQNKYCTILAHGINNEADHFASMALFESFIDWIVDQGIPCLSITDFYDLIP